MSGLQTNDKKFFEAIVGRFSPGENISRKEAQEIFDEFVDLPISTLYRVVLNPKFRISRGYYRVPEFAELFEENLMPKKQTKNIEIETTEEEIAMAGVVPMSQARSAHPHRATQQEMEIESLVPEILEGFVPFGSYREVKTIVKSGKFYPTFITGLSGNGKTQGVVQACAELKREMIRVNLTVETDEDDLIGHYSLLGGETVWEDGPVVKAMERGAVLLLDEVDLASNRIMCLQPVLEGGNLFLKKVGRIVRPRAGFTVFATANTKGKGDETGQFAGTNVLNEAFLERFPVTLEQAYPNSNIEKKILEKEIARLTNSELTDEEMKFANDLCTWADIVRKTYVDGAVDEIISTRRLVHIVGAYSIFKKTNRAVELCCSRFDEDTKVSFIDLFNKVSGGEETAEEIVESMTEKVDSEEQ